VQLAAPAVCRAAFWWSFSPGLLCAVPRMEADVLIRPTLATAG